MSTDAAPRPARPKSQLTSDLGPPSASPSSAGPKIHKETVAIRDGLKVVRLIVPGGARVPEHHSSVVVVITVVRGSGVFTISGRPRPARAGDVIDLAPGVHHSIQAEEELEVVIVHARVGLPAPAAT